MKKFSEEDTLKLKSIYSSFEGFYRNSKNRNAVPQHIGNMYNSWIQEIAQITEDASFNTYQLESDEFYRSGSEIFVELESYTPKLEALISRLHGDFFSDLTSPFSTTPDIQINNSQVTSVQVSIVNFAIYLSDKMYETIDPKEKEFLTKLREKVSQAKNLIEIIQLIFITAHECGIDLHTLTHLFGK